jgi:response regulator of citrate/malate metabolism
MISVLVVDDDFMVARVHAGFVAKTSGFAVCGVAHSAAQAIDLARHLQPDLVLLDVHLPGASGLDLIAPLRAAAPDVDVLMITSEREAESVKRALRSGVVHYLMKPFSYETLRERLEHYRRTYRMLDERAEAEQADVDQLFGVRSRESAPPKGLSAETLRLVEAALREAPGDLSANEVAEALGLSRVSARRYLEYLVENGKARAAHKYGTVGRPERRFSWSA